MVSEKINANIISKIGNKNKVRITSAIEVKESLKDKYDLVVTLHKKLSFPERISSVNVTKSAGCQCWAEEETIKYILKGFCVICTIVVR